MFKKTALLPLTLAVSTLALVGCATSQPVQNLSKQPIPAGLSSKQIENSMETAGKMRSWVIKPVKPGLMEGDLYWHGHYAQISIPYNKQYYALNYQNSTNLNYHNGQIHRNYNKWITLLNKNIQEQLITELQQSQAKK